MPVCRHKIGFLSLRDCKSPVSANCSVCNRPVCGKHVKELNGASVCLECYVAQVPKDQAVSAGLGGIYGRRAYYGGGYMPYYFGYNTYGDEEYRRFDAQAKEISEKNEDVGPSDFQDS
jgi:hypothetical protein